MTSLAPLRRRPLLCLALLWAVGIWLAVHLAVPWLGWLAVAGLFLLAWACTISISRMTGYASLGLALLCLSAAVCTWQWTPARPGDLRYVPFGGVMVCGYALSAPTMTDYGWHVPFRVTARREGARWFSTRADVYLSGHGPALHPGRYCQVLGSNEPVDTPGNPVEFSFRSYLRERGLLYRVRASAVTLLDHPAPQPLLGTTRARCSRALHDAMPGSYGALHAQLLESLILGVYRSPLPEQLTETFRRAGTIHLLVVSGSQVALLGGIFLIPFAWLPYGRARASYPRIRLVFLVLSIPVLAVYVLLADRGPSVDRALFMVLLGIGSLLLALSPLARRRSFRPDGLTLLSAAGLLLLIGCPALLFNAGWQLSFTAVFGLLTITPKLMQLWRKLPTFISLPIAATLGAQLMTLPVLAWHFGTIPLFAPLTNLIAVPAVALLLPLGLFTQLCALIHPAAGMACHYLCLPLLDLLLYTSHLVAQCSWGQAIWYNHSPWVVFAYYSVLALGLRFLLRWADRNVQGWEVPAGREPRMW